MGYVAAIIQATLAFLAQTLTCHEMKVSYRSVNQQLSM